MNKQFKPLEKITNDSIRPGDLILLRKFRICNNGTIDISTKPVIYSGKDRIVNEGKNFSKGQRFAGIRVHYQLEPGGNLKYGNEFEDYNRGKFIPFNNDFSPIFNPKIKQGYLKSQKHEYFLLMRKEDLPSSDY